MRRRLAAILAALGLGLLSLRVALPCFAPDEDARLEGLLEDWEEGSPGPDVLAMRAINPEYDFMSRTFLVLALADRALLARQAHNSALVEAHIARIDAIVDDTLATEHARGQAHWLMPYWRPEATRGTGRSVYVDGEVLVMVTARRLLRDDRPDLRVETARRSELVRANLGSGSPLFIAESYANEGWTFCHAMALLGLRAESVLDGVDHSRVIEDVTAALSGPLSDDTGLVVSSFDMAGRALDGPEGSSIWFTTAAMSVVAPELSQRWYGLAKNALGRSILGLGYTREWPEGADAGVDVDSGPIVPVIEASASSSAFAIAAARVHGDDRYSRQLDDALGAAEALIRLTGPEVGAQLSNPVGDAVIVWATSVGPLFELLSPSSV